MKPLVYQIVIGILPEFLCKCVSSVKKYAKRHNYDYLCDTDLPQWAIDIGMRPREASEWMRAEKLSSRPYVLWVDWDLEIIEDFELKEEIITVPSIDSLLYYGPDTELAKKVLEEMGDRTKKVKDFAVDCYAFRRVYKGDYTKITLPNSSVWHYCYTIRKDANINTF